MEANSGSESSDRVPTSVDLHPENTTSPVDASPAATEEEHEPIPSAVRLSPVTAVTEAQYIS